MPPWSPALADLQTTADLCRLFGDPTRLRLLALLAGEELTVAELTAATGLAQSRVSSHLARLRGAGLTRSRRDGTSTIHGLEGPAMPAEARALWELHRASVRDALLEEDRARLAAHRARRGGTWAESVAGRMGRRYSPGRTWESAARSLSGLLRLGRVLDVASGDGALAELLLPRAESVTCLDISARVVAAGRERAPGLRFHRADMHALPFADGSFDQVLLINALSFAADPVRVVGEAARVLRPGGRLVASVLRAHRHADVAAQFDHRQPGFEPDALADLFGGAGLAVECCAVTSTERRPPHFQVVTVHAARPGNLP